MGISDRCLKHPEHYQARGVCPWCLRERLSRLSCSHPSSSNVATSLVDVASNGTTSSSGSFSGRRAISMVLRGRKHEGNLSRSHSVVSSASSAGEKVVERRKKPKRGLWRILVGSVRGKTSTMKEEDGILHSKERPSSAATWAL